MCCDIFRDVFFNKRTWTQQNIAFSCFQRGTQWGTVHSTLGVLGEGAFSCPLLCTSSTSSRTRVPMGPIRVHSCNGSYSSPKINSVLSVPLMLHNKSSYNCRSIMLLTSKRCRHRSGSNWWGFLRFIGTRSLCGRTCSWGVGLCRVACHMAFGDLRRSMGSIGGHKSFSRCEFSCLRWFYCFSTFSWKWSGSTFSPRTKRVSDLHCVVVQYCMRKISLPRQCPHIPSIS